MTQQQASQAEVDAMSRQLAAGLVVLSNALEPLREAVEGYRVQCERDGYPDALARSMAAEYHNALVRSLMR